MRCGTVREEGKKEGGKEDVLDFALALDEWGVWVHLEDLLGQRAVGTLLGGRGHHDGEVEELAELGVREDVLAVEGGVPVAGDLVEADLEVEDEEEGVVLVEALPWDGFGVLVVLLTKLVKGIATVTADGVEEGHAREEDAGSELHLGRLFAAQTLFAMLEAVGVA